MGNSSSLLDTHQILYHKKLDFGEKLVQELLIMLQKLIRFSVTETLHNRCQTLFKYATTM